MASSATLAVLQDRVRVATLAALAIGVLAVCAVVSPLLAHENFGAFVVAALAHGAIYAAAVWYVVRHGAGRWALVLIVAVAVLARLIAVATPATLSTDSYRYVWDGRVQAAGVNPYRYLPANPALAPLRDEAIYPHINRVDTAPTIYPPVAQMIFFAVSRVSETITAMKAAMAAFDLLSIFAIIRLLAWLGLPRERALIYAWHPLPIWEFAGNGHVDAAAIAFTCLTLLFVIRGRQFLAGIALAAAVLVKPFPLAIAPALWRRWDWRMPVAFTVSAAIFYLPYLSVRGRVFGYLGGYGDEEGYGDGWGFFFVAALRGLGLPAPSGATFAFVVIVLLGAIAATVALRPSSQPPQFAAAVVLASAFLLLLSPHFAWYFAWPLPILCVAVYPPLLYLTLMATILYSPAVLLWQNHFPVGLILYGGFAVLALVDLAIRHKLSLRARAT
jgi:hypothetical protein